MRWLELCSYSGIGNTGAGVTLVAALSRAQRHREIGHARPPRISAEFSGPFVRLPVRALVICRERQPVAHPSGRARHGGARRRARASLLNCFTPPQE